jgi:hypothetical protein
MPWRGPSVEGEQPTLGWEAVDWIEENVVIPDGEFAGQSMKLAQWQKDFLLGFYQLHADVPPCDHEQCTPPVCRVKPSRAFFYDRGGQLVAPQKDGKGPLAAATILFEAYGPCLFDGWNAAGEPVGRPWATPWIQCTAVSEDQTANVWRVLIPMISLGTLSHDIEDTGLTRINLPAGGRIEPVTASARSRLGQRITFSVQDEAHDWTKRNGGRKLADTQRRNLAGMGGRFMETGNAWDPAEDSVAQTTFEHETGVFKIMKHGGSGSIRNRRERMQVLKHLYGGSWWVDRDRISSEIDVLVERGDIAQAERFFMNRLVPGEDRAFDLKAWDHQTRDGVQIADKEMITIGVDGARFEDSLAVVATHISSGYQWILGVWERPDGAPDDYEHPMSEVDAVVIDAFERYYVWRMYCDPGSQFANIEPLVEKWSGRWGHKKVISWLMGRPRPTAYMVRNYVSAISTGDLTHSRDSVFRTHIANARRKATTVYDEDGRTMYIISKSSPRSREKIDAAAAGALSWEARGDAIAAGVQAASSYEDPTITCAECGHLRRHHVPACRGRECGCKVYVRREAA